MDRYQQAEEKLDLPYYQNTEEIDAMPTWSLILYIIIGLAVAALTVWLFFR